MPREFAYRANHPNAGIPARSFVKTVGKVEVHSYADAEKFLGNEESRIIASNVMVTRLDSRMIAIRLYDTDIIVYHKPTKTQEVFEADNGGFNTPTTATRCNQFGPIGYRFWHHHKKLRASGKETGRGVLLPVWTASGLHELAKSLSIKPRRVMREFHIPKTALMRQELWDCMLHLAARFIGEDPKSIATRLRKLAPKR